EDFKKRVSVLFQQNNSTKLPQALKRLGFQKITLLPHNKLISLTRDTKIYCYQVAQMDSVLAITNNGDVVLNVNDAAVSQQDCKRILKKIKKVDVILNQYSMAGYSGYPNYQALLPKKARAVLSEMYTIHSALNAKITIPFASLMYFSTIDNKFMNEYANKP